MKKSIKAIVCAASALVICAAPNAANYAGIASPTTTITAEAASFVSYSNNEVKFDESQINTTVSTFGATYISKGNVKSFTRSGVPMLERQRIDFIYKSPANAKDTASSDLADVRINVTFYADSSKKYTTTHDYTLIYNCIDETNQIYLCSCEFVSYGISYEASITNLRRKTEISNLKITSGSANYYKVEAKPSSGEKIYAIFPKKVGGTSLNTTYLKNWAKNQCLLANSLKELTGSSIDTIFVIPISYIPVKYIPIDPNTKEPVDNCLWTTTTSNSTWGGSPSKYAVIRLDDGGVKAEAALMNSSNARVMNKYFTHEMGHAYASFDGDNFGPDFDYHCIEARVKEGLGTADENYTNARALTAMNHCTNLKNYKIKDNANLLSIASVYDSGDTTFTFYFNQVLIKKIGFDRLERFYSGSTRRWNSAVNIKFANRLSGSTGLYLYNIPTITNANANQYKNFLMFANGLRGLYGYGTGSDANLREFVKNINKDFKVSGYSSGLDFIRNMAVYFLGNDLRGGK